MTGAGLRCVTSQTLGMFFIFYITRTTTTYVFFLPFFLILPMILLNRLRVRREERKKAPHVSFFSLLFHLYILTICFFTLLTAHHPILLPIASTPQRKGDDRENGAGGSRR